MKREVVKYFVNRISANYMSEISGDVDAIYDESLLKEELRSVIRIELAKRNKTKNDTFLVGDCIDGFSIEKYKEKIKKIDRLQKYFNIKY